jgi:hypothetical protein
VIAPSSAASTAADFVVPDRVARWAPDKLQMKLDDK